jgi:PPE-repeat protein
MDYTFLPPEINSARMYSGPGSGSLLAAAGSWDSLAAELSTTAETYGSVLSSLATLHWRGPASASMQATVTPYLGWLYKTAEHTKQTAMQARVAAAAFEQAYAMTVPPPAVTTNRVQLSSLIATNFFGQNTAAIAATEAQYAEMWAQDAAAMFGYGRSSAAATQLPPFSSPQQTTTPDALTAQSAAVSQAVSTPAGDAQSVLSGLESALSGFGQQVPGVPADFTALDGLFAVYSTVSDIQDVESFASGVIGAESNLGILPNLGAAATAVPAELAPAFTGVSQLNGAASGLGGVGLGNITASLARANTIGPMSVPGAWSAPSAHTVSALSGAGLTTLPGTDVLAESGSGMPGVPGMPAGTISRASGVIPRYGVRLTVMTRPLAGG